MHIQEIVLAATHGHYAPEGRVSSADCLIGFSFGYELKNNKLIPGTSNEQLAEFTKKYPELPKILQFEIADALKTEQAVHRIDANHEAGEYLDTYGVALQAKQIMVKNNYKTALLIAHSYHIPRIAVVCSKLVIAHVIPAG